jgi:hypothetical protein
MASPFALDAARQDLHDKIEAAIERYATGAPVELDLSFEESGTPEKGALSDAPDTLERAVRRLVRDFHAHEAVRDAGLHARHVTALDSDGDGRGSVNIRFVYRDEIEGDDPADLAAGEGGDEDEPIVPEEGD